MTGVTSPQYRTRQSLLQRMLSPLLSHQTVPVYPPPAQYNDYSGYSIPVPPPHFSVPKVNLTINARSDHGEQAMKAIIVHRFVQQNVNSLYSLTSYHGYIPNISIFTNSLHNQRNILNNRSMFHSAVIYGILLLIHL